MQGRCWVKFFFFSFCQRLEYFIFSNIIIIISLPVLLEKVVISVLGISGHHDDADSDDVIQFRILFKSEWFDYFVILLL